MGSDPRLLARLFGTKSPAESLAKSLAETLSETLGETLAETFHAKDSRQESCQESQIGSYSWLSTRLVFLRGVKMATALSLYAWNIQKCTLLIEKVTFQEKQHKIWIFFNKIWI